jgi:hypothetical protein
MILLRRLLTPAFLVVAFIGPSLVQAQTDLEKKLHDQYSLTKATADRTDIVTAGSVLILQKDSLLMDTVTSNSPLANTYQAGRLTHGVGDVLKSGVFKHFNPMAGHNVDTRTFVTGEKFWVTKVTVQPDGVVFDLFSDPVMDVRYYSTLKFAFPKGTTPSADQMMATIAEVLKVQPADDSADSKDGKKDAAPADKTAAAAAPAAPAAPAEAAMAPIAPPPPPADTPPPQPKTIAIGQTKDQVVAIFGQPTKVINLGTKEIDVYPDMKVTFVKGKVSDVQ